MKRICLLGLIPALAVYSCGQNASKQQAAATDTANFAKGTFGYDSVFLSSRDSLVILSAGNSRVIVSPKYQGKVFTSTADGDTGKSFGWINYKAFDGKPDEHMNAYGGEDRLWLGPEGGPFSLYFKPGTKMEFDNWHTPPAIDNQAWKLVSANGGEATLEKTTEMLNYANTPLKIKLARRIKILNSEDAQKELAITLGSDVKTVAFTTQNAITNTGDKAWDKTTGAPCLWNLDMLTPSDKTVIVIPYNEKAAGNVATTNYFGQIPPDRVKFDKGILLFKADGKSRGKLGMPPVRTKGVAGSYDAQNNVLTITTFDVHPNETYLNQEWRTDKPPFVGDAVNAYNDGPLANGTQMGPFYELESVSPAAFLKPGEKLVHNHTVYHFTGSRSALNAISFKILAISLDDIQAAFK
ncbi:DUF6786 family protein [Mucilaginibacter pedocola]|uniref:Uncharacterized protein n=1 Tax=Mucilaginibacter pedocola TaxID=1792845 RepID=A0A1S9PF97_9SPHI|nr:DUF6786 family protein [Mucilaginibacter pedocola]OOQ59635.1 hypothetical protein BC343_05580 [Mucilaginibacter pedocola]